MITVISCHSNSHFLSVRTFVCHIHSHSPCNFHKYCLSVSVYHVCTCTSQTHIHTRMHLWYAHICVQTYLRKRMHTFCFIANFALDILTQLLLLQPNRQTDGKKDRRTERGTDERTSGQTDIHKTNTSTQFSRALLCGQVSTHRVYILYIWPRTTGRACG